MLDSASVRQIARAYAHAVGEAMHPKAVILFGSHARGNPHENSDIDIAVVFNGFKGDWFDASVLLQRLRRGVDDGSGGGIEPHLLDESDDRSGFLSHIRKTGEILYGS